MFRLRAALTTSRTRRTTTSLLALLAFLAEVRAREAARGGVGEARKQEIGVKPWLRDTHADG
jgi:hypothetical protein